MATVVTNIKYSPNPHLESWHGTTPLRLRKDLYPRLKIMFFYKPLEAKDR